MEAICRCGQASKIVEGGGHLGMLRAEALFVNGQRPAIHLLGLGLAVGGLERVALSHGHTTSTLTETS